MQQTPNQQEWNPDQACEEMAELFRQADQIFLSPHYQQACCQHQRFEPSWR